MFVHFLREARPTQTRHTARFVFAKYLEKSRVVQDRVSRERERFNMIQTYPEVISTIPDLTKLHEIISSAFRAVEAVEQRYRHVLLGEQVYLQTICISSKETNEKEVQEIWYVRILKGPERRDAIPISATDDYTSDRQEELSDLLAGEIARVFFSKILSLLTVEEKNILLDVKRMQPHRSQDGGWVAAKDVASGLPSSAIMKKLQQIADKGALLVANSGFNGRRFKIAPQLLELVK